jgi:hypothetical protein
MLRAPSVILVSAFGEISQIRTTNAYVISGTRRARSTGMLLATCVQTGDSYVRGYWHLAECIRGECSRKAVWEFMEDSIDHRLVPSGERAKMVSKAVILRILMFVKSASAPRHAPARGNSTDLCCPASGARRKCY